MRKKTISTTLLIALTVALISPSNAQVYKEHYCGTGHITTFQAIEPTGVGADEEYLSFMIQVDNSIPLDKGAGIDPGPVPGEMITVGGQEYIRIMRQGDTEKFKAAMSTAQAAFLSGTPVLIWTRAGRCGWIFSGRDHPRIRLCDSDANAACRR